MMKTLVIRIADEAGDGHCYTHTYCSSWTQALTWIDQNNRISIHVDSPYKRGLSQARISILRKK